VSTHDAAAAISAEPGCVATVGATETPLPQHSGAANIVQAWEQPNCVGAFVVSCPIAGVLKFSTPGATATAITSIHFFESTPSVFSPAF